MGLCASSPRTPRGEVYGMRPSGPGATGGEDAASLPSLHQGNVNWCTPTPTASSPGVVATCGNDKTICQVDLAERQVVRTWSGHEKAVMRLSYNQETGTLFSASRDLTIRAWRPDSDGPVERLKGHEFTISALHCTRDAAPLLASGSRDTSVRVWDAATATCLVTVRRPRNIVTCLEWLPGSRSAIAQGSEDLCVRLWDVREDSMQPAATLDGYTYFPLALDVRDNYLLTASNGFDGSGCEGRLWDLRKQEQVTELRGHAQAATACAFATSQGPVGKLLCVAAPGGGGPNLMPHAPLCSAVTGSKDGMVKVWTVPASMGDCAYTFHEPEGRAITSLAAAPAGSGCSVLVTTFDGGLLALVLEDSGVLRCVCRTPLEEDVSPPAVASTGASGADSTPGGASTPAVSAGEKGGSGKSGPQSGPAQGPNKAARDLPEFSSIS